MNLGDVVKPLVLKATGVPTQLAVGALLTQLANKLGIVDTIRDEYWTARSDKEKLLVVAKIIGLAVAAGLISAAVSKVVYSVVVQQIYKGDTWITGPFALV